MSRKLQSQCMLDPILVWMSPDVGVSNLAARLCVHCQHLKPQISGISIGRQLAGANRAEGLAKVDRQELAYSVGRAR